MLHHQVTGLPEHELAKFEHKSFRLEFTNHARKASYSDRYGLIELLDEMMVETKKVFEVETDDRNGEVVKMCLRTQYNQDYDVTYVMRPKFNKMLVVTVWLNKASDNHPTLKKERYS